MSTPIGMSGLARINTAREAAFATAKATFFDDFLGDAVDAGWNLVEGTDSATSDAAILAGGVGGVLRMTSGDAGTGLAADMVQMTQALQWRASNGGLVAQARVKLSAITDAYLFFGFTDVVTLEAPFESAGAADTITSNASNAVGIMFDTRMTTDKFWLCGVKADTDAVHRDSGVAPVADEYLTLRVDVDEDGNASFMINGVAVGRAMADAVTPGTMLTPTLNLGKITGAASITADWDYVGVSMTRGLDGDAA